MPSFPIHRRLAALAALALTVLPPGGARAAHLFVDGGSAHAADTNPGSSARPLRTVGAALARARAGDTVTIRAGVYREAVEFKRSGAPGRPLTLEAAPGETVVLDQADPVTGWMKGADPQNRPLWRKAPWAQAKAFPIGRNDWAERTQLLVDDVQYTQVEHPEQLFPGSFYYDPANGGALTLWPLPPRAGAAPAVPPAQWWARPVNLASDDPNQHDVEVATRGWGLLAVNQGYLTIRGLTVRHGGSALGIILGGDDAPCHDIVLDHCAVEYAYAALACRGNHFLIRGCYFHDNGLGSGGGLTNSVMEDTVFDHNTTYGTSHGFSAGGIKFLWTVNTVIQRCQFINNDGPGLWFDTGNAGDTVEQNFCSYNSGAGIMMEVSPDYPSDKPDARPIVDGWAPRYMGVPAGGPAAPSVLRNNICVGNRWDGVAGDGILLQLASHTVVANNTLVGNAQYGIFGRYHPYAGGEHRVQDDTFINNLCVDNGGSQIFVTPDPVDRPGIVARNRSDYNLFFLTDSWRKRNESTGVRDYDEDRAGYGRWGKTQTDGTYSVEETFKIRGFEEHSLQGDPLFVSPATLDFRVQRGSPAIGAGTATPDVTDDYLGHPRPAGRPSTIGALEYAPGPQTPPAMPMADGRP